MAETALRRSAGRAARYSFHVGGFAHGGHSSKLEGAALWIGGDGDDPPLGFRELGISEPKVVDVSPMLVAPLLVGPRRVKERGVESLLRAPEGTVWEGAVLLGEWLACQRQNVLAFNLVLGFFYRA